MIGLLIIPLGRLVEANVAFPEVSVYPPSQTVDAIGNVFTANVCVSEVFNLYAYEFKLYYNSTVLNGTSVAEGSFLENSGQTPFFYVVAFTDHYNSTYGIVWIDSTLTGNVLGIDGDGVLATIKFNATTPSSSTSLSLRDVKLSDPNENPIPYVSSDGTVTVLPMNTANLTLGLSSAVNYLGSKVTISGVLSYKDVGIDGALILLSYRLTEGQTWNNITSTNTTFGGSYSAVWTPSVTGTYLIKSQWAGNDTFQPSEISRTLSVARAPDYMPYIVAGAIGLALIGTFLVLKRRRNSLRSLNKNGKVLSAPTYC
jgi:hypothetical protein